MSAPQTKSPRKAARVTAVQAISMAQLFSAGPPRGTGLPRRYRMQNTQTRPKTSANIAAQTPSSAMNSALTLSPLAALVGGQNETQRVAPAIGSLTGAADAGPTETTRRRPASRRY